MCNFYTFASNSPVLTFFLALMILIGAVEALKAIFSRKDKDDE